MKKFVKMSLVAAVTLAGLSSNASARTLTEVSDNFDVFGYANLRYDDNNTDNLILTPDNDPNTVDDPNTTDDRDDSSNYTHKIVLGATGKLTDDLSYMIAGTAFDAQEANDHIDYKSVLLVYSYFTYTGIKDTSISAGRIGLDTPFTVVYDPATATSEGDGLSIRTKLGPVNLEAAYFSNTNFEYGDRAGLVPNGVNNNGDRQYTNIDGGDSYIHVGLTTNLGPVALDAWYADMNDNYNVYTVGARANFDAGDTKITTYGRYTAADIDAIDEDQALWKVGVSAKMGIFGANLDYGETDEEGGWVTFDKDAGVNLKGWKIGLMGEEDAELLKGGLNVDILPNLNISANYIDMDVAGEDQTEVFGELKYEIKKGVTASVRLGQVDRDIDDDKRDFGRAQILWHF